MSEPPQEKKLFYITTGEIKQMIADKYQLNINEIDIQYHIKEVGGELNERFGSYIEFDGITIKAK